MFGRTKKEPEKKRKHDLSQFGIFDVPDDLGGGGSGGDDGDSDLEAELAALAGGSSKPKPKPKSKNLVPSADLDRMIAASLRDVDDDDSDIDENDPDLLNELSGITGDGADDNEGDQEQTEAPAATGGSVISLITSRIEMYKQAENNAKTAGDNGKARRIGRGLKTLQDQLKQANAGRSINVDDIPPEVTVKAAVAPPPPAPESSDDPPTPSIVPSRAAPAPPPSQPSSPPPQTITSTSPPKTPDTPTTEPIIDETILATLLARQKEYKIAALMAKKSNDIDKAKLMVKIAKMFDTVIDAAQKGKPVDLSDMPPPPNELPPEMMQAAAGDGGGSGESPPEPPKEESINLNKSDPSADVTQPVEIITAPTILGALEQRLEKYRSVEQAAKEEGNSSKIRRFGRIIKQYEDAIKLHKAGKVVQFDELPTPPGYGPIVDVQSTPAAPPPPAAVAPTPSPVVPSPPQRARPSPPQPVSSAEKSDTRGSGNFIMNKTINLLIERQAEFRKAAVEAKKNGDIESAKEYLRTFKGLEMILDKARGGLPIDLSTIPIAPSQRTALEDSFTIVNDGDCSVEDDGLGDISSRLEEQLQRQLTMCKTTRDHHKAMGDVAGTNRFENLALSVQKDLDLIRFSRKTNTAVPKFHYEQKSFDIVRSNTDLTESELEINIIRGIGYNVANPRDVDTYIKLELPYPQDTPFRAKSQLVRDSESPEYNEKFLAEIQPKNRQCQRVFKRHGVKFEIYSKGGFFRSDTLIGTSTVKLQPLETVCEIHDTFDIMDGRKTTGGKLEIKIRIKNPILVKQVQHTQEKWLIIDQ